MVSLVAFRASAQGKYKNDKLPQKRLESFPNVCWFVEPFWANGILARRSWECLAHSIPHRLRWKSGNCAVHWDQIPVQVLAPPTRRHSACRIFVANFVWISSYYLGSSLERIGEILLVVPPVAKPSCWNAYAAIGSRTGESILAFFRIQSTLVKGAVLRTLPGCEIRPLFFSLPLWQAQRLSWIAILRLFQCGCQVFGLWAWWSVNFVPGVLRRRDGLSLEREDGAEADSLVTMWETPRRRRRLLFLGLQTCPASLWCMFEVSARLGEESCTRSSSRPER